MARLIMACWHS